MNAEERINLIRERLTQALKPTLLEIIDESHFHKNHPGAKDGRGHFAVTIASSLFERKSLIEGHRMIYDLLENLMKTEIHALKIKILRN